MKKFIPLVSVLGLTSLLVCSNTKNVESKHNDFYQDVASFSESTNINILDSIKNTQKNIKNYAVKLNIPADATLVDTEPEIVDKINKDFTLYEKNTEEDLNPNVESDDNIEKNIIDDNTTYPDIVTLEEPPIIDTDTESIEEPQIDDEEDIENELDEEDQKLLTIYSLSRDIESTCDKYCELKNLLTETILESQTLIERIRKNEIELNAEQRLFLNEQSNELKNLGKELIRNNNELNIYLKDINGYFTDGNDDMDSICLKYLLLLNNLSEGEGIMNNSLASLSMMNNLMRFSSQVLPENNMGRILYGFQRNNEPPIIKNYDIDQDGNIIDRTPADSIINSTEQVNGEIEEKEKNIDNYKNKKLKTNIDSYRNNKNNIDSFFNMALLDNELMYGGNGMNYGGGFYPMMYGGNYGGYNNAYQNFNNQNNTYSMNNDYNTQYNQSSKNKNIRKKSKNLKKNVDTYRDDTTPNPKQRFKNLKAKISNIFSMKKNSKIDNFKNK